MTDLKQLILIISLMLFGLTPNYGQNEPVFLGDINQEEDGSNPRNFIATDVYVFFIASSGNGYDLWRTDGTEAGTTPLTWFNDRYEPSDWKHLIDFKDFEFIIQTVDGIYVTAGNEFSIEKISEAGISAKVHVNNDLIFWNEPSQIEGLDIIRTSDGTAEGSRTILNGYSLVRYINLESAVLLSVSDVDGNTRTYISDGTLEGTRLFVEAEVLSADESDGNYYFTAIYHKDSLFELYSKDKMTGEIAQLSSFDDSIVPDYSNIETHLSAFGGAVFFTKLVERNGGLERYPELHRHGEGNTELIGEQSDQGFEPDFVIKTIFGVLVLDGNNLYSINVNGSYSVIHSNLPILNSFSPLRDTYYHWDGGELYYFAGFSGSADLVVTNGFQNDTRIILADIPVGRVDFQIAFGGPEKPSTAIAFFGDKIICPGVETSGENELWTLEKTTGKATLLKNISSATRSFSWNQQGFVEFDDHLFVVQNGEIWRTDGTPEGTIRIERTSMEAFKTSPKFIPDFEDLYLFGVTSQSDGINYYSLAQVDDNRLIKKWEGSLESDRGVKYLTRIGNEAVFSAPPINFSFDLTEEATHLKQPFSSAFPKGFSSPNREFLWPQHYTVVGDELFIRGADGSGSSNWDIEPWVVNLSDGSASLIKNINPTDNSFPREFVEFNGQVVFNARETFFKEKIYLTDGTLEGTSVFYEDFLEAEDEKLVSLSNLVAKRDKLYFNSFYQGTQRFKSVDRESSFETIDDRIMEGEFSDRVEDIFELGYFLVHYNGDEAQRAYDVASNSFREVDWSMLPTRQIEIGNYFFDALSYGSISRWNKLTLEEEIYSDDPNGELPYTTLGSKLIILKYAEGFGHELWALDVGLQDRLAHLPEMEVKAGEPFLPYISDIETASFTFSISNSEAITYEDGLFSGVINGVHTLDLQFDEDEIYKGGTVAITVEVTEGETVTGLNAMSDFKVYPNPTSGRIAVTSPQKGKFRVSVVDLSGRLWQESVTLLGNLSLELGRLPEGLYLLQVEGNNGIREARKILIQR
ncbi:MAG: T9SS type A sorting domain-containing protein [Cyclobacteriaceae bacterium]